MHMHVHGLGPVARQNEAAYRKVDRFEFRGAKRGEVEGWSNLLLFWNFARSTRGVSCW
jgi:hypothetical protein